MRDRTSLLRTLPSLVLLWVVGTWPAFSQTSPIYAWTNFVGQPGGYGNANGTGSAARFNRPSGVAVDSAGNVFVADSDNGTIRKVTAAGAVTTLAGSAGNYGSADGTGSEARFSFPSGVAVDSVGNVFVADSGSGTIRKVTPAGAVTTLAGRAGNYGSADGTGSGARFSNPSGVAVDSVGNVFVADSRNYTIRKVTSAGVVTTLAGYPGSSGSADGTGSAGQFNWPSGVALDSAGNVFVADSGNGTIRKVTPAGAVTTLAGNAGNYGCADGAGSGARFSYPSGVAVDSVGNVFVADTDNNTIRKVTPAGMVTTLAGSAGNYGSADGTGSGARFSFPSGVAADSAGNVFVADQNNSTIRKVTAAGVVTTLAGYPGSYGTNDGTGSTARFYLPAGVAVDSAGIVFVADWANHTIRKVTSAGVVTTLAGSAGVRGSADGTGSTARFNGVSGVAVDGAGNVLVAECYNNTIRKVTPAGVVTTLAGDASITDQNGNPLGGYVDGTGILARFRFPQGVAVDSAGNVFVADTLNSTIRQVTSAGVVTTLAGDASITDQNGNPLGGYADGTGSAARFWNPQGVAVDSAGNVFVADSQNNTIRRVTPAGVVTTIGGVAGVIGGAGGLGSSAAFAAPYGIAVDSGGTLYVADSDNNTIWKGWPVEVGPIIQTLVATSVATTAAELHGYLNPNGYSTTAYFEYGTTPAYGNTTVSGNFGTTAQDISFRLSGLSPNTTYHYCLVGANSAGTNAGSDVTFLTPHVSGTPQPAWVSGTDGLGLRLRANPSLSAVVLMVLPEGAQVTLLGPSQTADGYLWLEAQFGGVSGWAASQYLVFTSPGTPPSAPIGLQQWQADGVTPISAGGTISGHSVVLGATASGLITEQLTIQFEIRPIGTAFSAPTCQSDLVGGGTQASVSAGGLSNQGYHWRARTLDGNGQPSDWVQFGTGSSADFTVGPANLVSALFDWSPLIPLAGSPVQFTAQAASQSGLSFAWDFGAGVTGTAASVSETFAAAGPVNVTLTVTDSNGNQATSTETVQVASPQLQDAINALAQNTSTLLDQLYSQGQQVADAADYFQTDTDDVSTQAAINTAFTLLGLGISAGEFEGWIQTSLGQEAVGAGITEIEQWAADWVGEHIVPGHPSYSSLFMPNIQAFIAQKKSEIEQQRLAAISASASLGQEQAAQLAQSLRARYAGNVAVSDDYFDKASLPSTFAQIKASDESSWTWIGAEVAFDTGVNAGLVALAPGLGATGALATMLDVSATSAFGELGQANALSQLSTDAQMLGVSVSVLGQATISAGTMATNAENGLQEVIQNQASAVPEGQISVQHVATGWLSQYGFSPRWMTTSAYAEVTVENTGIIPATYRVEALYPNTFTAEQLLPIYTFGLLARSYSLNVISVPNPVQLNPGQQQVVTINYMTASGGQIPSGVITYTLTAITSDGYYLEAITTGQFGTTLIDTNGQSFDHSQMPQVLLEDTPVTATLVQFSNSTVCSLLIKVQNSIENPVLFDIQQSLPVGTTVIDADGGTTTNNQVYWQLDLQPGESGLIHVTLDLPSPLNQPPLSNTLALAYDEVESDWVQLQAVPGLLQVTDFPPAHLQPISLTARGFGMTLETFVPGVYRLDASQDLKTWRPIISYTNVPGVIAVRDAGAATNRTQFYRAVKTQ